MTPARASLAEVLDFCNKVRASGGANPLDALMPAVPEDETQCLIARNLNFSCHVGIGTDPSSPKSYRRSDGTEHTYYGAFYRQTEPWESRPKWHMIVEDDEVRQRIAESLDLPVYDVMWNSCGEFDTVPGIELPEPIGLVAEQFDAVWNEGESNSELWSYIEESMRSSYEADYYDEDEAA